MARSRVMIVSDNEDIARTIEDVLTAGDFGDVAFDAACSPDSSLAGRSFLGRAIRPLDLRTEWERLADGSHSLVLSAHCRQMFPARLVESVRCVNIHPGFNPYNRGMFPHVFSLINGLPAGATIHEMDAQVDHGPIIARQQVPIQSADTSKSLYERVLVAERVLLATHLRSVILGQYQAAVPEEEGNVNTREDYERLKALNLDSIGRLDHHINKLRALTHGDLRNAYFVDKETGRRIWVRITLSPESD